eukprot:gene9542-12852_t
MEESRISIIKDALAIRENIAEKVESFKWLENVKREEELFNSRLIETAKTFGGERCLVCTLPYGTCDHTISWIDDFKLIKDGQNDLNRLFDKSEVDQEIEDALGMISDDFYGPTKPVLDDIDINAMQWSVLDQRKSDKIGETEVCLFAPSERGWHSCVDINHKFLFVFGGFSYRHNKIPQPFQHVPDSNEIQYLSDIRIYDIENLSWHAVKPPSGFIARGNQEYFESDDFAPEGRYGHAAAALSNDRMMIFGGKGNHGQIYGDTWIYEHISNRWILVQNNEAYGVPSPAPRFFSSCITENDLVYLFGGTDGNDNYGDLWVFKGDPSMLRWERIVAVGIPPSPRYGHQFINISPGKYAVVGGCTVSPQGEVIGTNLSIADTKHLLELNSNLQKHYRNEGKYIKNSSVVLEASTISNNVNDVSLDKILHQAANITSQLHLLESETRFAEQKLVDSWHLSKANRNYNIGRARHPNPNLDIIFLDTIEMTWKTQQYPPIRGKIPCSRIHFGCAKIGDYLLVMGGVDPTSLVYKHVDESYTRVYTLNLNNYIWEHPIPINSTESLQDALRIAQADIIRAKNKIKEEKARGLSLGALNGKTVELAEAEIVLKVCHWRHSVLLNEEKQLNAPPMSRFGSAVLSLHQRLIYIGGWNQSQAAASGDVMVLSLEQEHEKRRRLDDEFKARLERNRIKEEAEAHMANVQSVYELRAIKQAQLDAEENERRLMAIEEIISSLPPLSMPRKPRYVMSNQHSIWVEWDRVNINANKEKIDPNSVTYYLYMETGFENLLINDRVMVAPVEYQTSGAVNRPEEMFFDEKCIRFPGEVTRLCCHGQFDILFDDGIIEKNVERCRIKRDYTRILLQDLLKNVDLNALSKPDDLIPILTARTNDSNKSQLLSTNTIPLTVKARYQRKLQQKKRAQKKLELIRYGPPIDYDKLEREGIISVNSRKSRRKSLNSINNSRQGSEMNGTGRMSNNDQLTSGFNTGRESSSWKTITSSQRNSSAMKLGDDFLDDIYSENNEDDNSYDNDTVDEESYDGENDIESDKKYITVRPNPAWKLVYAGNENNYCCTSIIPDDILLREPSISVAVSFRLQIHGLDYPKYECSQFSTPLICFTTNNNDNNRLTIPSPLGEHKNKSIISLSSASITDTMSNSQLSHNMTSNASHNSQMNQTVNTASNSSSISKTKKQLISAVINGQQLVEIEKRGDAFYSEGIADDYI